MTDPSPRVLFLFCLPLFVCACSDFGGPTAPAGPARVTPNLVDLDLDPVVIWRDGGSFRVSAWVEGESVADLDGLGIELALLFADPPPSRSPQYLLREGNPVTWVDLVADEGEIPWVPAARRFTSAPLRAVESEPAPLGTWFPIIATAVRYDFPDTTIAAGIPAEARLRVSLFDADAKEIEVPEVHDVAPGVRHSRHVVSLAMPRKQSAVAVRWENDIAERYSDHFTHEPDFLVAYPFDAFVAAGFSGSYRMFRNDVEGVGLPKLESEEAPGTERLRGMVMSVTGGPDPVSNSFLRHELLHQWAAHFEPSLGVTSASHWATTFNRQATGFTNAPYNDVELYLMGLLPLDSVLPAEIGFHGTTMQDVVERHGARKPAWPDAQRDFSMVTLLVYHRILTADEMALFDFLVAEFGQEARHPARTDSPVLTFHEATGGRATMTTRVLPDPAGPRDLLTAALAPGPYWNSPAAPGAVPSVCDLPHPPERSDQRGRQLPRGPSTGSSCYK